MHLGNRDASVMVQLRKEQWAGDDQGSHPQEGGAATMCRRPAGIRIWTGRLFLHGEMGSAMGLT
jgi:hypothetical protein